MKEYSRADIEAIMPQQEPFLFLESVKIDGYEAFGTYKIKGSEDFLRGHFKGNPVFPGTLMLEALGQLGVFYILKSDAKELSKPVDPFKIFITSIEGARALRICRPGDELEIYTNASRLRHPLAMFEGRMSVKGERAAFAEKFCLTFDYKNI